MAKAEEKAVFTALQKFAAGVTAKMTTLTAGEPVDQLRGPFETFLREVGRALSRKIVCTGETRLAGRQFNNCGNQFAILNSLDFCTDIRFNKLLCASRLQKT